MKITVAGAGTWGTALGRVLAQNGHSVCIWSRFREEADSLAETRRHPNLPGTEIPASILFTSICIEMGLRREGARAAARPRKSRTQTDAAGSRGFHCTV